MDNFKLETVRDLLLLDILGALLVLVIFLVPNLSFLRIVLGVPFVLFFPGYFLVSALFPGKEDLDGLERLALSLGLSLALVPLIGLVLNYTPFGIRLWPVTISLYLFMLVMTWIAQYRRGNLPRGEAFGLEVFKHLPSWSQMAREDKILAVGSVVAILAAVVGGYFLASGRHGEAFTEFYVLGPEGKMENYPTDLQTGESGEIIVGIQNHEYKRENYTVFMTIDNQPLKPPMNDITLKHEENWQKTVTFQLQDPGENKKLQFLLHKDNGGEPYRKLHLWVTVENRG